MHSQLALPFLTVWLTLLNCSVGAEDSAQIAFFEQKIRPALIKYCYQCHSQEADKLKGGLLLDSRTGWSMGGDSGQSVIVPGRPDESLLIQYIRYEDGLEMPPDEKMPADVIADLTQWVAAGAVDPRIDESFKAQRADKSWWSLQPLATVTPIPTDATAAAAATIDDFLLAKLSPHELTFNPPADARTLIRRMSYAVIGLPPSAAEVNEFARAYADNPQTATEKLVDRLLASPHYGEHWGRHWLDVVRFGESAGFERNVIIDDLWPFRDYVIASLNDDKPFNRFIQEHLAGDVLAPDDPQVAVGSAFLVAGPYDDVGNQDVAAQANIRAATLDEIITATSGAFLGLTINCARCHNHKFDPIPAEDYYRLRAAFEGVQHGRRALATQDERREHARAVKPLQEQKNGLNAELEKLESVIDQRAREKLADRKFARPKVDPRVPNEETFAATEAKFVKFVMHASTDRPNSATGARLVEFEVWTHGDDSQNVALASRGAVASGPRSTVAEDFLEAYGPQFTNDGRFGEQWFIGSPAELTIELAQPAVIDRIVFSNAKGKDIQDKAQGATPVEYAVQVSLDGQSWRTVAESLDRQPWTTQHGLERLKPDVTTDAERQQIQALRKRLADVEAQLKAIEPLRQVWVGSHKQPQQPTRLHVGGDPLKEAEVVPPASLAVLADVMQGFELPPDAAESERRLELARWITADSNPLTARVLANRLWHYHFGTGIVDTPSDFGFLGGRPSHPALLDWLAGRLIAHGWRLKPLHREILLSRAYRQSSAFREQAASVDADARLLWRFPPRRLSAEELRDTLLMVAGKLQGVGSEELAGGPGFRLYKFTQNNVCTYFPLDEHGPETYRRAVYHQNARASVVDLLTDFDLPDIAFAAPVRAQTTTPLQALTMLNHSFTLDMAAALATRAQQETSSRRPRMLVKTLYALTLQREPDKQELAAAAAFLKEHGAQALCRAMLNFNEVLYVE